jgi:hypothetical protein
MNIIRSRKGLALPSIIIFVVVAVLIVMTVANVFTVGGINTAISGKIVAFEDKYGPAEIRVTKLLYQDCNECFSLNQVMETINNLGASVTEISVLGYDSQEAQTLIDKYDIQRLPTVIVSGETSKDNIKSVWKQLWDEKEDETVVFSGQTLPYYDTSKQKVIGQVTISNIVDSSCTQCIDMSTLANAFKQAGVAITSEETFEYNTPEAKEVIEEFDIQKVPSIIISSDITEYDAVKQIWDQLNATEKEGYYVLHALQPPFRDLQNGEISGLVKLVKIVDGSCFDCFNVSLFETTLQGFGVAFSDIEEYDISSTDGKVLVDKYGITKVPTVLISPETSEYPALSQIWPQVGSIADDGWFVFRQPAAFGEDAVYRDIVNE